MYTSRLLPGFIPPSRSDPFSHRPGTGGCAFVLSDGNSEIGAVELADAATGARFHLGWNRHVHSLRVEVVAESNGISWAEIHADPASFAEFLIHEKLEPFHRALLKTLDRITGSILLSYSIVKARLYHRDARMASWID
jgi:hypothetical protein